MEMVKFFNRRVTSNQRLGSYTELCAKFVKRTSCCVALMMVLLFGAMFVSCTDPIIPNTDNAQQPNITAQPADVFWNVYNNTNPASLTVTANVTDGGTLTYQWYSNTNKNATGGTAITTSGTSKTLSLNKSSYIANGSFYFYVVITNTNNEVDGTKTASVTSSVAEVVVVGNPDTAYTTNAMPENLKGTWTSEYGEIFIINNDTFTSKYGDYITYAGTIVANGHRSNSNGDGYITIKYTENSGFVNSENKFYVIHYKNLSISEVTLAGASLSADPDFEYGVGPGGKTTQAEAEAVMTVSAGYFEWYSILDKEGYTNADHPDFSAQPSSGNWNVSANNTHTLTVTASISDSGSLSYQWYSNTSASNAGGTIMSGKTSAALQLEKTNYTINGTYYFYVIVTNTNNSVNGNKTASETSEAATVTVSGNVSTPSFDELFAPFIGDWKDPSFGAVEWYITYPKGIKYDMWGYAGFEATAHEIIYYNENEGMIFVEYTKIIGSWDREGSGDFTGVYFKNNANGSKAILSLSTGLKTPMWSTLETAKTTLTKAYLDANKLIQISINYVKN